MGSGPQFAGKGFLIAGTCSEPLYAIGRATTSRGAHTVVCGPGLPQHAYRQPRLLTIPGDVTEESTVDQFIDRAMEELPRLDAVVIVTPSATDVPMAEIGVLEWKLTVLDNLRACFLISRRAVEEFLAVRSPGRIVFASGWYGDEQAVAPKSEIIDSALLR